MAKQGSDFGGDINLGSDAWNVADGYTKLKILRQLIMLDRWDTIAQFGTEEIDEDLSHDNNQIKKRRVEALQRFHSTIKQLLGNVVFALRKEDQDNVKELVKRVEMAGEFVPKAFSTKEDMINHEDLFEVEEPLFKKIIEILQDVKDKLNTPLNNAGLIFRPTEEVDLDKIMNEIVEGG
ncbi:MAG: hypothetical protein DRN27_06535 [Thermoplasmata archaeon]|nr:MAG: hypothetical protein DRN27_06535 [Thermoplasmata archaeon]